LSRKVKGFPSESFFSGAFKRFLQILAYLAPGESTLRVWLHRLRGVQIGSDLHIGMATLIETSFPEWVFIGNHVTIGMRTTIIAHMLGLPPRQGGKSEKYVSVRIEDEAFVGPGVVILPNVTIGRGSVVTAGSVVTRSVPAMTMVQGNPAKPIGHCGVALLWGTSIKEFYAKLRPL
jgi:acetyltransferase-like isoleucine patch superfamily enzyme